MNSRENFNNNGVVQDKHIENEKTIEELEVKIDELKFIAETTKEYLFILEQERNNKDKKINSLQKDIKNKNKEIKSLKRNNKKIIEENNALKSSTSWKITSPLRKIMNMFRR